VLAIRTDEVRVPEAEEVLLF